TGDLEFGHKVILERKKDSYPAFFTELLKPEDAVELFHYNSTKEQAEHVAELVQRNIETDELDPDDVLIVMPNVLTANKDSVVIRDALSRRGIESHMPGVTSSLDEMISTGSVAVVNIHRAKGNEAPMVYVVNCQECMSDRGSSYLRNVLFTAITRS